MLTAVAEETEMSEEVRVCSSGSCSPVMVIVSRVNVPPVTSKIGTDKLDRRVKVKLENESSPAEMPNTASPVASALTFLFTVFPSSALMEVD